MDSIWRIDDLYKPDGGEPDFVEGFSEFAPSPDPFDPLAWTGQPEGDAWGHWLRCGWSRKGDCRELGR